MLEDRDGLARSAGLLQQYRKVHRHETVVFAGGQHRAQCRYGGLQPTGSRLQHGSLASLGDLRLFCCCASHSRNQKPARNDPSTSEVHHCVSSPGSGLWFGVGLRDLPP